MMMLNASAAPASSQSKATALKNPSGKESMDFAIFSPRPEYPYSALQQRITGSGIAVMKVDSKTGRVVRAFMYMSTGSPLLDEATLSAFRQWKFKPGTVALVKVPINYTMMGGSHVSYERHAKSMDDELARYLGKGTVLKGPIPEYPSGTRWGFKEGRGVYELHAGKSGSVESVKVIKSSGDPVFDSVAQQTLVKWRLSRGPLTLELPLCFMLTPDSYRVYMAR
jgi:TonB family protein